MTTRSYAGGVVSAGALITVLASCDDQMAPPVAPKAASLQPRLNVKEARDPEQKSKGWFPCAISQRESQQNTKFRSGRLMLKFKDDAISPTGALVRYVLAVRSPAGDTTAMAVCSVPQTDEAIRVMNRYVARLSDEQAAQQVRFVEAAVTAKTHSGGYAASLSAAPSERPLADYIPVLPNVYVVAQYPGYGYWGGYGPTACNGGGYCDYSMQLNLEYNQGAWSDTPWPDAAEPPLPTSANPDSCKTPVALINDVAKDEGLARLWTASNPSASIGERREKAGWIVRDAQGVVRVREWNLPSTVCGMDGTPPEPPEGWASIIGFVHTHPYKVGEPIPVCGSNMNQVTGFNTYLGVESDADKETSKIFGQEIPWSGRPAPLPGIYLDNDAVQKFVGSDSNQHQGAQRCGY